MKGVVVKGDVMKGLIAKYLAPMLSAFVFVLTSAQLQAEIYKYQDASGRWHFTDKKPQTKKRRLEKIDPLNRSVVDSPIDNTAQDKSLPPSDDIAADLVARYRPQSTIEKTTLGVVTVKTTAGLGSGFFISNDGYIVTNRHVIRPEKRKKVAYDEQQQLNYLRNSIKTARHNVSVYSKRLKNMQPRLNQYKYDYESSDFQSEKAAAKEKYVNYKKRYSDSETSLKRSRERLAKHKRNLARHEQKMSDLNRKLVFANTARRFDIVLKNGARLKADLVKISKEHDLALLKVNDKKTPVLSLSKDKYLRQGERVYAFGSPRGDMDSVTSGIVTGLNQKHIKIDAMISPGNSGGPLVNEQGDVVGVNTVLYTQTGFGGAIPIRYVHESFPGHLGPLNTLETLK